MSDRCERDGVPNEFFPHHGNLSKEIRESLEARLQLEKKPTTAVCTMTLELGIDIGSVDSIAQVFPPHSVASLRQRLGRSGRRENAAILRLFIPEEKITARSHPVEKLRMDTIQSVAMINLLLRKWYEPAPARPYHLSTLVQQTLSVIGQYGGVRANQLWSLLCETGPFSLVDKALYARFLKDLGLQELITQTHDGLLVLGYKGEKLVGHYTFYTAFQTHEEYRLECEGRVLGSMPMDRPMVVGQYIIFAGKRWEILQVNAEKKLVILKQALSGRAPSFSGSAQRVHDIVRKEMRRVYQEKKIPLYLNQTAKSTFEEGLEYYHIFKLDKVNMIQNGNTVYVFPWLGDRVIHTLTFLLCQEGLKAAWANGIIDISDSSIEPVCRAFESIYHRPKPTPESLASDVADTLVDKYDFVLSTEIRALGYGVKSFDIEGAWNWLKEHSELGFSDSK